MQMSEKDKQALHEKYKMQRQAMWSGKQSTPQDSEGQTTGADQGDMAEDTGDSTNIPSSQPQSDSASIEADPPAITETTNQDESNRQTESDTEATPITEDAGEQEELATEGERVFWEEHRERGRSPVTWKLAIAVIGVAIVLIGVGVYLGFLFAG